MRANIFEGKPRVALKPALVNAFSSLHIGIFLLALTTLMYEILLTRIFSLTLFYHYAFLAVSIALFGMTVGALTVFIFPKAFDLSRVHYKLVIYSLAFAISLVVCHWIYLSMHPVNEFSIQALREGRSIAYVYMLVAIPFVFSGICTCVLLTQFPKQLSGLYAADLIGAALGCVLLIQLLGMTDASTAMIVIAAIAGFSSIVFLPKKCGKLFRWETRLVVLMVSLFALYATVCAQQGAPLMRITWVKGRYEQQKLLEKWNAFSYIWVWNAKRDVAFGWGMSPTAQLPKTNPMMLEIDASAGTLLVPFTGDFNEVAYIRKDITNLVHTVKNDADVLIIGAGGGRDVLSALSFGQRNIVAVEYNKDILKIANGVFGDVTGHLDLYPNVTYVADEARTYLSSSARSFDVIQISLIDTWAATAAGAFVLTENSLYTLDAWNLYLDRLKARGIISCSRWYLLNNPAEMYRLTATAAEALRLSGVENPRDHLYIARTITRRSRQDGPEGVGTLLVKKDPFTREEIQALDSAVARLQFETVLNSRICVDPAYERLTAAWGADSFIRSYPLNIEPTTDDSPFFFNMVRVADAFDRSLMQLGVMSFNQRAVRVLVGLLGFVLLLSILCIGFPILFTVKRVAVPAKRSLFWLGYFISIGMAFMLIEISQMQRLTLFLGHPIYSLAVVLFSLLLASGLGSAFTSVVFQRGKSGYALLAALIGVVAACGCLTPWIVHNLISMPTSTRIAIAGVLIFVMGFPMGMAFPCGMHAVQQREGALSPWLWGANGASSVFASVLAVVIALEWGISAAYWTGVFFYGWAFFIFWSMRPTDRTRSPSIEAQSIAKPQ